MYRNKEDGIVEKRTPKEKRKVIQTSKIIKDVDSQGNKMVNHFVILNELGRGVHGKVKLCRDTETGQEFVPKKFNSRQSKSWIKTLVNDFNRNFRWRTSKLKTKR